MKRAVLVLLALGLSTFVWSQALEPQSGEYELEGVTIRPLNLTYVNSVREEYMPPSVHNLENRAARFDIRDLKAYNGKFEAYEVFFRQHNGTIVATYDKDGQILESSEKFKNIALPPVVRNQLYLDYPGWIISKDIYIVSYYKGGKVDKTCKVQLKNGKFKKTVTVSL